MTLYRPCVPLSKRTDLRRTDEIIAELERDAEAADWQGDYDRAERLYAKADGFRKAGSLYEPLF